MTAEVNEGLIIKDETIDYIGDMEVYVYIHDFLNGLEELKVNMIRTISESTGSYTLN